MTSFQKEEANTADSKTQTKEESKTVVVVPPPESKIKADKKLWFEAGVLADMLTFCRPNNSKAERGFIGKYLCPLGVTFDKKGNAHLIIGDAPVIWSSHTDTVHSKSGMQKIIYWVDDKSGDTFFGSDGPNASCLGADDTAGIWIMLNMIKAKIPGHYIFHRGEECGGLGSRWIAKECTEMLKNYQFAIAFDRRDTNSIITHQGSRKTASDEFAKLLAEQIGMGHTPDHTGMWTDTAAYVDDVAECTNISVGYYGAHGKTEKLNLDYLFKLRDAMCKIDVSKFVATRKPGDNSYRYQYNGGRYHGSYDHHWDHDAWEQDKSKWNEEAEKLRPKGGYRTHELDKLYGYNQWYQWYAWDKETFYWVPIKGCTPPNPEKYRRKREKKQTGGWYKQQQEMFSTKNELREMKRLISDNPAMIADLLDSQGYGPLELKDYIKTCGGLVWDEIIID